MVMDNEDGPLTDFDWKVLAMRPFHGVQLRVPMPSEKEHLHTLAQRLASLAEELHILARLPGRTRSAIMDAAGLIRERNHAFRRLAADWEEEYRELCGDAVERTYQNETPPRLKLLKPANRFHPDSAGS